MILRLAQVVFFIYLRHLFFHVFIYLKIEYILSVAHCYVIGNISFFPGGK